MTADSDLGNADLTAIETQLGRPLRVLHIGNIANNAYNNARIQRQYGIEADVLSYDYYHVMSTPEWEDGNFEGQVNSDAPDWWSTSLNGWKRPDWFVQGPASGCLQYLRAKHFGYDRLRKLLWRYLEARCFAHVRYVAKRDGSTPPRVRIKLALPMLAAVSFDVASGPSLTLTDNAKARIRDAVVQTARGEHASTSEASSGEHSHSSGVLPQANSSPGTAGSFPLNLARAIWRLFVDFAVVPGLKNPSQTGFISRWWLKSRVTRKSGTDAEHALRLLNSSSSGQQQLRKCLTSEIRRAADRLLTAAGSCIYAFAIPQARQLARYNAGLKTAERDAAFCQLMDGYRDEFRRLPLHDRVTFFDFYSTFGVQFSDIFHLYDVVQAYSIDGCLCAINGYPDFVSYEHGTLRDLPFHDNFYGIVTRMAYRASKFVFVTNSDVLPSTEKLGLDPSGIVCLPHAFDDRKLLRFRKENSQLRPAAGPVTIFSPTRHHWKDRSGSWTKGNDILIRAAGRVAAEGRDFRLHFVEWGQDVADSRSLIEEVGIGDKVVWGPTMKKRELWAAYCQSHAVADQFILPALGGVGFETMALGRRLITALDTDQLTHFFGAPPPCLIASDVDQCAAQLRLVIADPDDAERRGEAAQNWMQEYHSAKRIIDLQAAVYRKLLAARQRPNAAMESCA